jgi:hypothetical protein
MILLFVNLKSQGFWGYFVCDISTNQVGEVFPGVSGGGFSKKPPDLWQTNFYSPKLFSRFSLTQEAQRKAIKRNAVSRSCRAGTATRRAPTF